MKNVTFEALPCDGSRDGENGWKVLVDGQPVIESVNDLDIGNNDLDPLWEVLGVSLKFDFD